jgi:hypothetical protein
MRAELSSNVPEDFAKNIRRKSLEERSARLAPPKAR